MSRVTQKVYFAKNIKTFLPSNFPAKKFTVHCKRTLKKKIYAWKIFNSYLFQTESPSHPTKRGIQELPLALMNATATTVQPILVSNLYILFDNYWVLHYKPAKSIGSFHTDFEYFDSKTDHSLRPYGGTFRFMWQKCAKIHCKCIKDKVQLFKAFREKISDFFYFLLPV